MIRISFKYRLTLLAGLVVILLIIYASLFSKEDEPNVFVILRYDDYATESTTDIEKEILNAVKKYGISCSFGVIPFSQVVSSSNDTTFVPIAPSKVEMVYDMVQDGSVEICQHGFSHSDMNVGASSTEFKGLPMNRQLIKINAAKNVLDTAFGIKTRTFIPPWNSYDQRTVEALSELGFQNISADNKEIGLDHSNLALIPFTVYISDLKDLINQKSLPYYEQNAVMVWMLHDYDFQEVDPEMGFTNVEEFNTLLSRMIEQNWKIVSIENALIHFDIFDLQHYKRNRFKLSLLDHLSPLTKLPVIFNKLGLLSDFYLSTGQVNRLIVITVIYYICLLLLVIELVILISHWIPIKASFKKILLFGALILIIVFAALFWVDDHSYGKNEMVLILLLTGLFVGMLPGKKATD